MEQPTLKLIEHLNHNLTITQFGSKVVLLCNTCQSDLVEQKVESTFKHPTASDAASCNMDEGCLSCGS